MTRLIDDQGVCRTAPAAVGLLITLQEHIISAHLEDWLDDHQEGLGKYAEQAAESVHHTFNIRVWQHFKVPAGSKK